MRFGTTERCRLLVTCGLEVASADGDGWLAASTEPCDLVVVSGGWSPVGNLLSHRGVKPVWDSTQACFLTVECAEPISVAGSAAGVWNSDDCVASGLAAAGGQFNLQGPKRIKSSPERGVASRFRPL
ncbi:MAG: hypothetical protein CM1200mP18_21640 [Gammaproteobacteria bacterium]|nr:MAG: hypothetical protein CM1200mP18_21640 [Gammaproteobacteria bacterium]